MNPYRITCLILGAIIIGGFIYLAIRDDGSNPKQTQGIATSDVAMTSLPQNSSVISSGVNSGVNTAACGASDNTIVTKVIDGDTVVARSTERN